MSHSVQSIERGMEILLVSATIVNYVAGGEQLTALEISAGPIRSVLFGTVPAAQNSLGVPLFPLLVGGKITLFRFVSGSPVEIPPTVALNAVVTALVLV